MARGWESKSVEAQQDDAARAKQPRRALSAEERAALERRRGLELARTKAKADLAAAKAPAHRAMLEQAIAALEHELTVLDALGE